MAMTVMTKTDFGNFTPKMMEVNVEFNFRLYIDASVAR